MNLKTNPELLPLIEWWEKDGKSTVIWCLVAALAVGGWFGYKARVKHNREAASNALSEMSSTVQAEAAVREYGDLPVGGMMKLQLAKMYFDEERYADALAVYEDLIAKTPDGFVGMPEVGKAQCLEALGRFAEAQKTFDEFAAANPKHYLTLAAQLGSVRCLAHQEKKSEAVKAVAALKEQYKDDKVAKARVEMTEDLVKRWDKSVMESVMNPAPVPAAKPAAAPVPAAKPAAAPVVKPAAAPAKPAEPAKK